MGIQGLLKGLSQHLISENETSTNNEINHNICQFANKSLAIDTSSWLYKASYSCAERVVEAMESKRIDPTCERIICNYIIKRCDELLTNALVKEIILVFDGKRCPLKAVTNRERENRRTKNLKEARQLKASGKMREAQEKYKCCLKVTDWMAHRVNRAVVQKWGNEKHSVSPPKVRSVFSPYEADAQLAKLCIDGLADAIVTEDSDILVYSAACGVPFPIIYKLDRNSGNCDVISMDWLFSKSGVSKEFVPHNLSFPSLRRCLSSSSDCRTDRKATQKMKKTKKGAGTALLSLLQTMVTRESRQPGSGARLFVQSCILSGCDYAPSRLSGVGLVTAFKMIVDNSHRDPDSRFSHVLKLIPREKISLDIDEDNAQFNEIEPYRKHKPEPYDLYEELLSKSEAVFYHHHVLHLKSMDIAPLMMPKSSASDGMAKSTVSDEQVHSPTDNSNRTQYFPCLNRFAANISFIGSDQGHVGSVSGGVFTSTPFSTSKLSSSCSKQPQILCHASREKSQLVSKKLFPITSKKRKSQELGCSWMNRKKVNPLSKFAFHSTETNKTPGISQIKETKEDKYLISNKRNRPFSGDQRGQHLSKASICGPEDAMQKYPLGLKSGCFKGIHQSCAISPPADRSYRQNQRVDSMSSVSSIDSPSINQCITNGQKVQKKQIWSKYFMGKKDEDVSVSLKPIFTTEENNTECCVEGVRSGNLITPTSDIRQNTRHILSEITTQGDVKSSDRGQRKLNDFLSDEEDSDSVVIISTSAPQVSSLHVLPYSTDILDDKDTTIGVDCLSAIIKTTDTSAKYIKKRFSLNNKKQSKNPARIFPSHFKQSTRAKKRIRTSLHPTKKQSNTQSIKGFFRPLTTKN